MQKPRIPPHPTTKQEILFLRRMGFPAQKKMKRLLEYDDEYDFRRCKTVEQATEMLTEYLTEEY